MKHIITIFLLPLTLLYATPINKEQAFNVALNFATLNNKTLILDDTLMSPMKRSTHPKSKETPYYFINLKPRGWVLVSGNDVIDPIIGFSFDASIDKNSSLPPQLVSMLDGIESTINYLESHGTRIRAKTSNQWNELSVDPQLFKVNIEDFRIRHKILREKEVKPLLTTNWHQGSPYNAYTPIFGSKHAPVGCVATAVAQIMAYHQWPKQGIGQHVNKYNSSLSINFTTTNYNWINMNNKDIAKISYHVGVATDMKYNSTGSSTNLVKAAYALKTYFKYTVSNKIIEGNHIISNSLWHTKLQNNIDKGLPVLYAGLKKSSIEVIVLDSNNSGHAVVCDGYKTKTYRTYYHFNYGWDDPKYNAYYNLNILPFAGTEKFDFPYRNHALVDIQPNKGHISNNINLFKNILPMLTMMILE